MANATMAAAEQQAALYRDYAAFQSVFPECQQALKAAMTMVVKERPADPIAYLAMKLREANVELKLEKMQAEQEQESAAVVIQKLGRGKKDKKRVQQIKTNNGIFVREL